MLKRASLLSCLVLAGAMTPALAMDPGYCDRYARSAIVQFRRAADIPGCFRGPLTIRWAPNYQAHYGWCLGASRYATQSEVRTRVLALQNCRHRAGY